MNFGTKLIVINAITKRPCSKRWSIPIYIWISGGSIRNHLRSWPCLCSDWPILKLSHLVELIICTRGSSPFHLCRAFVKDGRGGLLWHFRRRIWQRRRPVCFPISTQCDSIQIAGVDDYQTGHSGKVGLNLCILLQVSANFTTYLSHCPMYRS